MKPLLKEKASYHLAKAITTGFLKLFGSEEYKANVAQTKANILARNPSLSDQQLEAMAENSELDKFILAYMTLPENQKRLTPKDINDLLNWRRRLTQTFNKYNNMNSRDWVPEKLKAAGNQAPKPKPPSDDSSDDDDDKGAGAAATGDDSSDDDDDGYYSADDEHPDEKLLKLKDEMMGMENEMNNKVQTVKSKYKQKYQMKEQEMEAMRVTLQLQSQNLEEKDALITKLKDDNRVALLQMQSDMEKLQKQMDDFAKEYPAGVKHLQERLNPIRDNWNEVNVQNRNRWNPLVNVSQRIRASLGPRSNLFTKKEEQQVQQMNQAQATWEEWRQNRKETLDNDVRIIENQSRERIKGIISQRKREDEQRRKTLNLGLNPTTDANPYSIKGLQDTSKWQEEYEKEREKY